ncbi:MAG TPA: hypothetical protein VN752_09315 [Solirubrobacterales bacterium]|nr:hypothetical protein [Solirubrobacterales bacterium]
MTELDPERLLRVLVHHKVDFCVIGAVAAWLQGSPTATLDLDVMPRRELVNADRLAAALNELGARRAGDAAPLELEGTDFLGWQTQRFETEAGPLDVVPLAAAIGGFEDVATVELALGELSIRVITIDEVIASKEELGRPKDNAALPALYAAREVLRQERRERGAPKDEGPAGAGPSSGN